MSEHGTLRCALCQHENPPKEEICGGCLGPLQADCPRCGFENPPGFHFCGRCGAALREIAEGSGESTAERRQLTVMFCDLVGSTALSERLEPEELREIVRRYQEVCQRVIAGFEGHIAQYLGDGILVYFGYPRAHEDDAQRAVHSALAILEKMTTLNDVLEPRHGLRLSVRVGIDTGPVVAGEVGAGDRLENLALGQTPNIAARIQGLAEPDTVLLSEATHQLLRGTFDCTLLGSFQLKGISRPVEVLRAEAAHAPQRLFESTSHKANPIVGREREQEQIATLADRLTEGRGGTLLLGGEAGIGKSRLVESLAERAESEGWRWLEGSGSPFFRNTAFHSLGMLLEHALGFGRNDSETVRLTTLTETLERHGFELAESLPFLGLLLGLPPSPEYPLPALSPPRRKELTLDLLVRFFLALAERRTTLVVIEDLHWIDPSTCELLDRLIPRLGDQPLLLILSHRPTFDPPWTGETGVTSLVLGRLSEEATVTMVHHLTLGAPFPENVLQQIVERTDGVPIFVEELTKAILESGLLRRSPEGFVLDGPLTLQAIPRTLQDSLMARLDRLPEAKRIAQQGSVLGREFDYDLLRAAFPSHSSELERSLDQLIAAELLYRAEGAPGTFIFKHALVQEAAYSSLLKSTRSRYHQQIAQALAARFPDVAERQPEIVAVHYTEAGLGDLAVGYWQRAGQRAVERSNNHEALGHLGKGLGLIEYIEEGPERDQQELALQATFGSAASAIKGFAAPDVARAYERALELCEAMGKNSELFWIYWGLWAFHVMRANLEQAEALSRRLVELAEGNDNLLMEGLFAVGSTLVFRGGLEEARATLERALDLDHPERDRSNAFLTGQDVGVTTRSYLALALWQQGFPERALAVSLEAIAEARRLSHPFSLISALATNCSLHQLRGEPEEVLRSAEEAIALSERLGFFWVAQGNVMMGWAQGMLAEPEEIDDATERIRGGVDAILATGSRLSVPYSLSLLAAIEERWGRPEAARKVLEQAFEVAGETGERFNEPDFFRLLGRIHHATEGVDHPATRETLDRALEVARAQGSRSLELRISLDRSRLLTGEAGQQGIAELTALVQSDLEESPALSAAREIVG